MCELKQSVARPADAVAAQHSHGDARGLQRDPVPQLPVAVEEPCANQMQESVVRSLEEGEQCEEFVPEQQAFERGSCDECHDRIAARGQEGQVGLHVGHRTRGQHEVGCEDVRLQRQQ